MCKAHMRKIALGSLALEQTVGEEVYRHRQAELANLTPEKQFTLADWVRATTPPKSCATSRSSASAIRGRGRAGQALSLRPRRGGGDLRPAG